MTDDRKRTTNVYRLRATALCPVDGLRDHYDVEIRTFARINAEDIRAFFESKANESIFQEALSQEAASTFGGTVTITGDHPSPIRIESGGTS